jgi:hypothetical protein
MGCKYEDEMGDCTIGEQAGLTADCNCYEEEEF